MKQDSELWYLKPKNKESQGRSHLIYSQERTSLKFCMFIVRNIKPCQTEMFSYNQYM